VPNWRTPLEKVGIGKGRVIREGNDLAILSIGHIGNYAVEVCDQLEKDAISIGHFDMRFVKPLDEELLHHIFKKYSKVITIEDGTIVGGFGSAVLEFMADHNYRIQLVRMGLPDRVIEHGEQMELHQECGIDPASIYKTAIRLLQAQEVVS
jgi:1-deoxy-D-xylulose-5-phosphate synthase